MLALFLIAGCRSSSSDPDGAVGGDLSPTGDGPGPAATSLVVTEFMADPQAVFDSQGEWFEIHNPTANEVDLDGWTIKDGKSDSHVIKGPLSIKAGAYIVLARDKNAATNGGVQAAYQYDSFLLNNGGDQITLVDKSGATVNHLSYASSWGIYAGVSNALKAPNLDNTQQASWCNSGEKWSGSAGDTGSPGGPNSCGSITPPDAGPGYDGLPYLQHYLSFNESLCPGIASGAKKITLRNGHRTGFAVGEWIKLICSTSKTTFKGQLTVIRHTTYGGITAQEYTADGFSSQADMMQGMSQYYPGITLTSPATVFRWTGTAPLP